MFIFSLARELKKTVREIELTMDAAELMEWAAYFKTCDPEQAARLKQEITTQEENMKTLRSFLCLVRGK